MAILLKASEALQKEASLPKITLQNFVINYRFDAYMVDIDDLRIHLGGFRLLEASEPLLLPVFQNIRFLITADDVIHSWAVPCMGVKVDAVPGRLN